MNMRRNSIVCVTLCVVCTIGLASCIPNQNPAPVGAGNQCSLNGKILFTTNRSGSYNIAIMDSDGKNAALLTHDGLSTVNQHPVFTGDCNRIAWDRNGRIWLMNIDGSNAKQLPAPAGSEHVGHPWVGSNGTIYFIHGIGHAHSIWRMDIDGSNTKQLTRDDADRFHPSVRNDGNILVYTFSAMGATAGQAINVLDQTTGREKTLYAPGWPVSAATWHPDGQSVVVAEDEGRTGQFSIVQVAYPGGNRIRSLVSGSDNTIPYFEYPAAQWINWVRCCGGSQDRDIWRAKADGSSSEALTGGPSEDTKIVGWTIVETPGAPGTAPGRVCVPRPATCSPNPPPCPLPPTGTPNPPPPGSERPTG